MYSNGGGQFFYHTVSRFRSICKLFVHLFVSFHFHYYSLWLFALILVVPLIISTFYQMVLSHNAGPVAVMLPVAVVATSR